MKVFVYGTLKKGYYNHGWLGSNPKFLKIKKISGFTLYDTGHGYPAAVRTKGKSIVGEVYDVPESTYKRIKSMELGAGYKEITIKNIKVFIYPNDRLNKLYHAPPIGEEW